MSCSSSLTNIAEPLVLDTSVLINLHACKYGERILAAIPNDILVPEIVAEELEHETSRRNGEHGFLYSLVVNGTVTLARLTEVEYKIFYELTSIAPSLGDGEAATIAVAATKNFLPVIDEKRGRACALAKARATGWSLDIFRHPTTLATLGDQSAIDALYLALRDGRMRIPPESADGVIGIIGIERSRDCTCLPGYRDRFLGTPDRSSDVGSAAAADLKTGG